MDSTIADALSLTSPDRPPVEALLDHARGRRLLLVLDNFEHLLEAAPELGSLLDGAPGLRVLATSRAPLRLPGEQEYPLGPLPVPGGIDFGVGTDPARFDSLALFADRAREVDPAFALDGDNAALVTRIVSRVDGLPLAIELAAASLRGLSLRELSGEWTIHFPCSHPDPPTGRTVS